MTKRVTQIAGLSALALAVAASAFADIKINDNFAVGGYAVGSANFVQTKPSSGPTTSTSKLDGDAYKLWSNVTFAPVTGTISLYAGQAGDPVILDAYATYDAGSGVKLTFGKFLSWLGYEAFDPINMTQITYGWQTPQGLAVANIPAYHTGVKLEVGNDSYAAGLAITDSADPGASKLGIEKGDGDLKNGPGLEVYFTYKGVKDLTVFIGAFHEKNNGVDGNDGEYYPAGAPYYAAPYNLPYSDDVTKSAIDVWVQYVIGNTTLAAEYSVRKDDWKHTQDFAATTTVEKPTAPIIGAPDKLSTFWLAEVQQVLSKKVVLTGRVSWIGLDYKDVDMSAYTKATLPTATVQDPSALTFTIAPAITLTPNLSIVFEYSLTSYKGYLESERDDPTTTLVDESYKRKTGQFVAVQTRFKF